MTENWIGYAGLITALVAFTQFWVWQIIRRSSTRGQITVAALGTPEIGFDLNGPHIAIAGSFTATRGDVHVLSMELTLTQKKTHKTRTFLWAGFKPSYAVSAGDGSAWLPPEGFGISPLMPRRFIALFHDFPTAQEMKPILHRYRQNWYEAVQRFSEGNGLGRPSFDNSDSSEMSKSLLDAVNDFKRSPICMHSYTELDRLCYWEHGDYSLSLKIITEEEPDSIGREADFNLPKGDVKFLKANCVEMLDEPIAKFLRKPAKGYDLVYAQPTAGWQKARTVAPSPPATSD